MAKKKFWIQDAVKRPGALRKKLHALKGKNIPEGKVDKAASAKGKPGKKMSKGKLLTKKQALFAQNMKALREKRRARKSAA